MESEYQTLERDADEQSLSKEYSPSPFEDSERFSYNPSIKRISEGNEGDQHDDP
jgi:hypothetical protein